MSNKNINLAPVHVIKDEFGVWNPTAPASRLVECNASTYVANELLRIATDGDNCGMFEEGSVATVASANTVATVKLRTAKYGHIWISEADYAAMLTYCNECCVS